jgi:hypothetical protein
MNKHIDCPSQQLVHHVAAAAADDDGRDRGATVLL